MSFRTAETSHTFAGAFAKLKRRWFSSPIKFEGSAEDICAAILARLWNGSFYETGLGHFNHFWVRDFGTVAEALVTIGEKEKVLRTLDWALAKYRAFGRVTLCLLKDGTAFDRPERSIDALPWLFRAICASGMRLFPEDRLFLSGELARFICKFINPETGLVREGARFSELRDVVIYRQSAYAVTMLASLARDARALDFDVGALGLCDYPALLCREYWNGAYFNADIGNGAWSSECNIFPFWLDVVDDVEMFASVSRVVRDKKLAEPFPLRYTDEPRAFRHRLPQKWLLPNYADTAIWTWLGVVYLHLLFRFRDEAFKTSFRSFKSLIANYGNFPELLHPDGRWYETPFYRAEEGMIWAALYLELELVRIAKSR